MDNIDYEKEAKLPPRRYLRNATKLVNTLRVVSTMTSLAAGFFGGLWLEDYNTEKNSAQVIQTQSISDEEYYVNHLIEELDEIGDRATDLAKSIIYEDENDDCYSIFIGLSEISQSAQINEDRLAKTRKITIEDREAKRLRKAMFEFSKERVEQNCD